MPSKRSAAGSSSDPPPESPLPTSPRSLNRQAKLHRLLKQLHSQAGDGSADEAAGPNGFGIPGGGALGPLGDGTAGSRPVNGTAVVDGSGGGRGRKGKRAREDDADEFSATAGGVGGSSSSASRPGGRPPPLEVDVDTANSHRHGSGGGGRGRGGGRGGGGSSSDAAPSSSHQQPQPNFRGGRKGKRPQASGGGGSSDGAPVLAAPRCIFKGHTFTTDAPPEVSYQFSSVPAVEKDLSGTVLLRPVSRRQWFVCIQELESLAQESLDRRAARLSMNVPSGLPLVYIADRMDIDDPLWGYQLRCESSGWLQGFITCTTFTTWTHFFEWNSMHIASGMAAARVANSLVGKPDEALTYSEGGETVLQVANRCDVKPADLVKWNLGRYPNISVNSRVQPGTELFIADPGHVDKLTVEKAGETTRKLAQRLGFQVEDLLQLNQDEHPDLTATTKLKAGMELIVRDRSSEPEVFLPTAKQERALDEDGSIAAELQTQEHSGDPTTTGVVWPKVAELGLLAGLGSGKLLVRLALEELRASGTYEFVVLQATMASVSFYEELGFVRVGAIAKYHPEGTSLEKNPMQGYRHWACADESQVEQFGDTSYMMAQNLKTRTPDHAITRLLSKRLVSDWPAVEGAPASGKRKGKHGGSHHKSANAAGILKPVGSSLQVGDLPLDMASACF